MSNSSTIKPALVVPNQILLVKVNQSHWIFFFEPLVRDHFSQINIFPLDQKRQTACRVAQRAQNFLGHIAFVQSDHGLFFFFFKILQILQKKTKLNALDTKIYLKKYFTLVLVSVSLSVSLLTEECAPDSFFFLSLASNFLIIVLQFKFSIGSQLL